MIIADFWGKQEARGHFGKMLQFSVASQSSVNKWYSQIFVLLGSEEAQK